VESTGGQSADAIIKNGVRGAADVDGIAVRSEHELSVLAWNYHDDDIPAPASDVRLNLTGLPRDATRVLVHHYRIDETHSNAYTAWKKMNSPEKPTPEQYAALEGAGQLQMLESPRWIDLRGGAARLDFSLPRQGISLVQISW
jgi:xylan 1,4-beta-xylosidase